MEKSKRRRGAQIMINHGALVLDERAIQANRRMFVQSNAHSASAGKRTRLSQQQQQQQERRALLMCFCLVSRFWAYAYSAAADNKKEE
jgi:hypothetical protein